MEFVPIRNIRLFHKNTTPPIGVWSWYEQYDAVVSLVGKINCPTYSEGDLIVKVDTQCAQFTPTEWVTHNIVESYRNQVPTLGVQEYVVAINTGEHSLTFKRFSSITRADAAIRFTRKDGFFPLYLPTNIEVYHHVEFTPEKFLSYYDVEHILAVEREIKGVK